MSEIIEIIEKGAIKYIKKSFSICTEIIKKVAIEYIKKSFSICDESPTNKESIKKRKSKILTFITIVFIAAIVFIPVIVFIASGYVLGKIVWLYIELCEGLSYIGATRLICGAMAVKFEVIYETLKTWTP